MCEHDSQIETIRTLIGEQIEKQRQSIGDDVCTIASVEPRLLPGSQKRLDRTVDPSNTADLLEEHLIEPSAPSLFILIVYVFGERVEAGHTSLADDVRVQVEYLEELCEVGLREIHLLRVQPFKILPFQRRLERNTLGVLAPCPLIEPVGVVAQPWDSKIHGIFLHLCMEWMICKKIGIGDLVLTV